MKELSQYSPKFADSDDKNNSIDLRNHQDATQDLAKFGADTNPRHKQS